MSLFLPEEGWHVRLKCEVTDARCPLSEDELDQYSFGIIEDEYPREVVIKKAFEVKRLNNSGQVRSVSECWFWTSEDPVGFPEDPGGREVEVCAGNSLLYDDRETALKDLAKVYDPVRILLDVAKR